MKKSSDRISDLPDEILHHILSFIPTLNSVATSTLSTRWKHLWKHVPKLTFQEFPPPLYTRKPSTPIKFANFVDNVFKFNTSKLLDNFYINCYVNPEFLYDVGSWVRESIMRNVKSIDLVVHYDDATAAVVSLPSDLFSCETLEAIKLRGEILVHVPTVVSLPNLKRLDLFGVHYQDDDKGDGFGYLISSCSSLQSLVVEGRRYTHRYVEGESFNDYVGIFDISSSTLRDVEIQLFESTSLIGYDPVIFCSVLRRLNLKNSSRGKIRIPSSVFTCETLELLSLEGSFVICDARTICLPNLTKLSLLRVKYEDDEFLSTIISSSTSLESVAVEKSIKADLKIYSCTVKVVEVKLFCSIRPGHKLVINAPALNCLKLKSSGWVVYHMEDIASLEQAEVNIDFDGVSYDHRDRVFTYLFHTLRHVKRLKIYHYSGDGYLERAVPMFNRLTELDITINSDLSSMLQKFIKNSTKLEILTICVLMVEDSPYYCYRWVNPNRVPACLLSSLRSVSISSFKGRNNELEMAKYFLEEARLMEKMEVSFSLYFHDSSKFAKRSFRDVRYFSEKREAAMREVCKEILNFPRLSKKCEMSFKDQKKKLLIE